MTHERPDATRRGFRDVVAWQKADELATAVYRAVKDLPPNHRWLADQILRCALSVPANIAEGHGRGTKPELLHFCDIARGSLSELEYYIHFLGKESLLSERQMAELEAGRITTGRVLFGLWRSLKAMAKDEWDHTGNRLRDETEEYLTL